MKSPPKRYSLLIDGARYFILISWMDMPVKAFLRLKQLMEKLSEGGLVVNIVGEVLVIPSSESKSSEYSKHMLWSKIVDDYLDIKTN